MNACLPPAALDGQEVITAEGLGSVDDVHPVQEEMAVRGGSQCGYCTPGFICSMAAEYYRPERPTDSDHGPNGFDIHALSGNLCPRTGYRPIRDAAYALGDPTDDDALAARRGDPAPASAATDLHRPDTPTGELGRYRRPTRLAEAVEILSLEPDVLVVAGATDWGVEVNIKGARAKSALAIDRSPELRGVRWTETHVEIGAANTLSEIERELAGSVRARQALPAVRLAPHPQRCDDRRQPRHRLADRRHPAGPPRPRGRARAHLGGRGAGRAAGRLLHRLPADRARARRAHHCDPDPRRSPRSPRSRRSPSAASTTSRRSPSATPSTSPTASWTKPASASAASRRPARALATEAAIEGRPWTLETVHDAAETLAAEGTPMDDHRASSRYRTAMPRSSLERFFAEQLGASGPGMIRTEAGR